MTYRPRRLRRQDSLQRPQSRSVLLVRLAIGFLILLSIPIALECFARILAGVTGISNELNRSDEPASVTAYRLAIRSPQGNLLTSELPAGQLLATHSSLLGYSLTPDRRSNYWRINSSGFRDDEAIAVEKPEGEIRIALLGGSTAFGQLTSGNSATIAEQLEAQLNSRVARQQDNPDDFQPERLPFFADRVSEVLSLPPRIREENYRVINAAVPGYASSNELAWYVQHVAAYDPDIVVVLNGYADVFLPSDRLGVEGVDTDRLAAVSQMSLGRFAWQEVKVWLGNLTLVRGFDYYVLSPEEEPAWRSALGLNQFVSRSAEDRETSSPSDDAESVASGLNASLPADGTEQRRRLARYRNSLQQMAQFSSGMGSQLLIAVQPELTGRDTDLLTPTERAIAQALGSNYRDAVPEMFEQLGDAADEVAETSDDAEAINLYETLNEMEGGAFRSPDSLTDEANAVVADRLFEQVTEMVVVFPRPFDPNRDDRREP